MSQTRNRLVIIGIALLFFGPLVLAVLMQSKWWQYRPAGTTNRGELVEPAVRFPDDAIEGARDADGRWRVIYLVPAECGRDCNDDAAGLRQVHIASGRHREHLVVALMATRPFTELPAQHWASVYPEFRLLLDTTGTAHDALDDAIPNVDAAGPTREARLERRAFLLDPSANIILAYPPGFLASDVKKDLERLLK